MEAMIKQFMASMSKEDKQKMIQQFLSSMSEEERMEIMKIMMPIIMKDIPTLMANMMKEMSPETRENCKKMMMECLKTIEET